MPGDSPCAARTAAARAAPALAAAALAAAALTTAVATAVYTMFEALPEDTPSISIVQFKMWWLKVSGGVKAEASSDMMGKLADHVSASRAS